MEDALIERKGKVDDASAPSVAGEAANGRHMGCLIKVDGVAKRYVDRSQGPPALDSVNIEIRAGDFVAIMGPSGSGKTTLLSVIGGMNPPSEGKVFVDGVDVYDLSGDRQADYRNAYLGFLFQQHHLLSHLTAQENVLLSVAMNNPDGSALDAAMVALERVGLADKAHRLPGEMSGGEQARVAIARCLMRNPPIVLADEPTGALDSRTGQQILSLLVRLNDQGHTVVMVTHSEEAAKCARRVLRLCDGRIVSDERIRPESFDDSCNDGSDTLRESSLARARESFAHARRTTRTVVNYAVGLALAFQMLLILYLIWQGLTGPLDH